MKNNAFNYKDILEWANLNHVYAAVIEYYSNASRRTLIDADIAVYRSAEEANSAAKWFYETHLTTHERPRVRAFAAIVRRSDLRDDLRDWRADEAGEDIPDWLAIGDLDTFPDAYNSDKEDDENE